MENLRIKDTLSGTLPPYVGKWDNDLLSILENVYILVIIGYTFKLKGALNVKSI